MSPMTKNYDLILVGSGLVGASLACALVICRAIAANNLTRGWWH
jgi:hypothetical protein